MMYKHFLLKTAAVTLLLLNGALTSAQVTMGANKPPETFSVLELISGNNKGLRLPQMTAKQRDDMEKTFNSSTLAMGLQIFNTNSKCVETWNGAGWIKQCATPDCVMINGVCWATRNVNAFGTFVDEPKDNGMYYQWSRPTAWAQTDDVTGLDEFDQWNFPITDTEWEAVNDPCPTGWRLPTKAEFDLLVSAFHSFELNYKESGVIGALFGTSPNQIFLPAAGYQNNYEVGAILVGMSGIYWSSTYKGTVGFDENQANDLFFSLITDPSIILSSYHTNIRAQSIRCVKND